MDYGEAGRARRQEIMRTRFVVMLALSLHACAAAATELGRMFFTPEQRATLDKTRKQSTRAATDPEFKPPPVPVPQNVSVTGVIRRSDGKHTIWLNNRLMDEHRTSGINAGVGRRDDQVRLRVPERGRGVDLKVGQTLEIVSGRIEENYARRAPAKSAAGATVENANSAPDVSKVTPPPSREPVKSESLAQRRPARAVDNDDAEDFKPKLRMEAK